MVSAMSWSWRRAGWAVAIRGATRPWCAPTTCCRTTRSSSAMRAPCGRPCHASSTSMSSMSRPRRCRFRDTRFDGVRARVFRISYSGQLAYEIHVGAKHGERLWDAVAAAGTPFGIAPYGVEALDVMRIEKGHCAGSEFDGRTAPAELGLDRMTGRVSASIPFISCWSGFVGPAHTHSSRRDSRGRDGTIRSSGPRDRIRHRSDARSAHRVGHAPGIDRRR